MQYSRVNLSTDVSTTIGLRQHFSTNSFKRFNNVIVHGVWQHVHENDEDGVQAQPQSPLHEDTTLGS